MSGSADGQNMQEGLRVPDNSRRNTMIIACTILTAFGTLAIVLRMYARGIVIKALGADDWTMFTAWFFNIVYLGVLGASAHLGTGMRAADFRPEWLTPVLKMVLVIQAVYYIIIYLIKTSILLFYIRFARNANENFHRFAKYTIYLLTVFLGICLLVVFVQCTPLEKTWLPVEYAMDPTKKARCINSTAFFYSTSIFNILTDVWILVMPLKLVWSIQRPRFEKVALLGVFAMGVFACIASCVRLYSIKLYTLSTDPLWDAIHVNIWSMIEINIAIVCASVPALKALFSSASRTHIFSNTSSSGGSTGTNPSPSKSGFPSFTSSRNKRGHGPSTSSSSGQLGLTTTNSRMSESDLTQERFFGAHAGGMAHIQLGATIHVEAKDPVEFTPAKRLAETSYYNSSEVEFDDGAPGQGGAVDSYGYGVQAVGTPRDTFVGSARLKEVDPEQGVIIYQRDVEIRSELRSPTGVGSSYSLGREVDVEDGQRYGVRPGGRRGGN